MPENLPPLPDALRRPTAPPSQPKVDIFNDPFNPPEPPPGGPVRQAGASAAEEKPKEQAPSGLAQLDAPHVFASVLGSGLGRVAGLVVVCMLAFGLTDACYRLSLLVQGWRDGGITGFFGAIVATPGAIFASPGRWFTSLGDGILQPMGVPYLLLFFGGVILAVRSEIHFTRLALFYAFLGSIHAAAYYKMTNPLSVLCWIGVLAGYVWLYRWYWNQQLQVEEDCEVEEESFDA